MGPGTLERCGHGLSSSLLLTTNACALILMALWLQRDGALRGHVAHSARLGCSGWADATARSCSSNIQQRCAAIEEKWPNIPLQITSLWRRCVVLLLNQTNSRYYPTMWVRAGVTLMMQRLRHADRAAARGLVRTSGLRMLTADRYWLLAKAGPWLDVLVITMRCLLTRVVYEAYLDI